MFIVKCLGLLDYFDVNGTYSFNDNYNLTIGIDNLFDKKPPIMDDNQGRSNTYPATYDVFIRQFSKDQFEEIIHNLKKHRIAKVSVTRLNIPDSENIIAWHISADRC